MPKLLITRFLQKSRTKYLILVIILACLSLLIIYHSMGDNRQVPTSSSRVEAGADPEESIQLIEQINTEVVKEKSREELKCSTVRPLKNVDISTPEVYPTLNFKPPYRSYWNYTFERRYLKIKENWDKLPLEVSNLINAVFDFNYNLILLLKYYT